MVLPRIPRPGIVVYRAHGDDPARIAGSADCVPSGPLITRGGHHHCARVPQLVYLSDKIAIFMKNFLIIGSDGYIDDPYVQFLSVMYNPLQTVHNIINGTVSPAIQNFDADELGLRCNAGVESLGGKAAAGGDTGHMAAVSAVVIGKRLVVHGVIPAGYAGAKIRMSGQTGIHNGDTDIFSENSPSVGAVGPDGLPHMIHDAASPQIHLMEKDGKSDYGRLCDSNIQKR